MIKTMQNTNELKKVIIYDNNEKIIDLLHRVRAYPKEYKEIFNRIAPNYLEIFINRVINTKKLKIKNNTIIKEIIYTIILIGQHHKNIKPLLFKLIKYLYGDIVMEGLIIKTNNNIKNVIEDIENKDELYNIIIKYYIDFLIENINVIEEDNEFKTTLKLNQLDYKYTIRMWKDKDKVLIIITDKLENELEFYDIIKYEEDYIRIPLGRNSKPYKFEYDFYLGNVITNIINIGIKEHNINLVKEYLNKLYNFIENNIIMLGNTKEKLNELKDVQKTIKNLLEGKLTWGKLLKEILEYESINIDRVDLYNLKPEAEYNTKMEITVFDNMKIIISNIEIEIPDYRYECEDDYNNDINYEDYLNKKYFIKDITDYIDNTVIENIIIENIDKIRFEIKNGMLYGKLDTKDIKNEDISYEINKLLDHYIEEYLDHDKIEEDRKRYIAGALCINLEVNNNNNLTDYIYSMCVEGELYFDSKKEIVDYYAEKINIWKHVRDITQEIADDYIDNVIINCCIRDYLDDVVDVNLIEEVISEISNENLDMYDIAKEIIIKYMPKNRYNNINLTTENIIIGYIETNKENLNMEEVYKVLKEYEIDIRREYEKK